MTRLPGRRLVLGVLAAVVVLGAVLIWSRVSEDEAVTRADYCDPPALVEDLPELADAAVPITVAFRQVGSVEGAVGAASGPDGSMLVVSREGRLWQVADGDAPRVLLDLTDEIATESVEQGLLGVTMSPDGSLVYLHGTFDDGTARVLELAIRDGAVAPGSRRDVFVVADPGPTHNGGRIAFGPEGMLYVALGDGGDGASTGAAQDLSSPFGKLLRIDPTASDAGTYGIPPDNPFVDASGVLGEIWAYGFRNPWGWSFDRATGDLWVGDVGQICFEEISVAPRQGIGGNFGWSHLEGAHEFSGPALGEGGVPDDDAPVADLGPVPGDLVPPVIEYEHGSESCSVIGGFVYRGAAVPDLEGVYLWADLCRQAIFTLRRDGERWDSGQLAGEIPPAIVAFAQDNDGELYVLSLSEGILRIVPDEPDPDA